MKLRMAPIGALIALCTLAAIDAATVDRFAQLPLAGNPYHFKWAYDISPPLVFDRCSASPPCSAGQRR